MSKTDAKHYDFPNGVRTIDITQHLDFCSGNVVKYVCRAGKKNGESSLDDLKKAVWYLNQLIEREEADALKQADVVAVETSGTTDILFSGPCSLSLRGGVHSWTD